MSRQASDHGASNFQRQTNVSGLKATGAVTAHIAGTVTPPAAGDPQPPREAQASAASTPGVGPLAASRASLSGSTLRAPLPRAPAPAQLKRDAEHGPQGMPAELWAKTLQYAGVRAQLSATQLGVGGGTMAQEAERLLRNEAALH